MKNTVIPKGWRKATKKELQCINSERNALWDTKNKTWILDFSVINHDGEVNLGDFHERYPMNMVYDEANRKLIVVTKKPLKKKKAVKKKK